MASSTAIDVGPLDLPKDVVMQLRARALEEHVSIPQFLRGIIKHFALGHDLSKIHFYQDGSGDSYDLCEVEKTHEEAMADDAAGKLETFYTDEEALEHLRKIRKAVEAGRSASDV